MKNTLYVTLGIVIIVVAVVAAAVFLIATGDVKPATAKFDFTGTWKLFNYDTPMTDEQYLVFSGDEVKGYKNGDSTPRITSNYEYIDGALKLTDLSIKYVTDRLSDNYLAMYDENGNEYALVRSTGDGIAAPTFDYDLLKGTWDVALHGKDAPTNEQMVFDGTTIQDYRGDTTPYLDSPYTIKDNNMLVIEKMGLEVNLCYLDAKLAIFVETQTGYAFELVRHK